jgi:predicted nucleotidyltransferase component of viral defense system
MLKNILEKIVLDEKRKNTPSFVIQNMLKEYLQYPVLNFLYSNKLYKQLIFTGGSCLRICYGMPRLSEDLDFDIPKELDGNFETELLGKQLKELFEKQYLVKIKIKVGENRIYLKFPILRELKLAGLSESDLLFVKLEFTPCKFDKYITELTPINKFGYNFVLKCYGLPFLMVGKVGAFFERVWFKGDENQIDIKGRDFYDLFWFVNKGVEPDWKTAEKFLDIKNKPEFKEKVIERVEKVASSQKLAYDLQNFFPNQEFVDDFCNNYLDFMKKVLENY